MKKRKVSNRKKLIFILFLKKQITEKKQQKKQKKIKNMIKKPIKIVKKKMFFEKLKKHQILKLKTSKVRVKLSFRHHKLSLLYFYYRASTLRV